jgi:hypothetical protein
MKTIIIAVVALLISGCVTKKPCVLGGEVVNKAYIVKLRAAYKETGYSDGAADIYISSVTHHCLIED